MKSRVICYAVFLVGLCSLVATGMVVMRQANGAQTLSAIVISLEEVSVVPNSDKPLTIVISISGEEGRVFRLRSLFLTIKTNDQTVGIRTQWPLSLECSGSTVLLTVPLDPGWDFVDRRSLDQLLPVSSKTWVMSGELGVTVPYGRRSWTIEFSTTREGT